MKYDFSKNFTANDAITYLTARFMQLHPEMKKKTARQIVINSLFSHVVIEEVLEQSDFILEKINADEINYL